MIISAGYRIGPFEVESACLEHPAVAEAAAVASPDERRGHVVKAFVVLAAGHEPSDALADEIKAFVRDNLSAYAYPRKVEFVDDLPKTLTGKIRRIELRQQEFEKSGLARAGVRAELGQDPFQPRLGLAVDVRHRRRDRRVHRGDLGVHLVRDGAVARVSLTA